MKRIKKTNVLYTLIVLLYFIFQIILLTTVPDIMEDEPWYANTAYNFVQGNGFTNTNVGHYGGDFFVIYTFLLSIGIKLFGCSLFVSRIISIIGGFVALLGLLSILKKLKTSLTINLLILLIFIFSNVNYIIFRTGRPEGWILAMGIWSVFHLIKYHTSKTVKNVLYASLFASLSFLMHPNGILFVINLGIYFLVDAFREKRVLNLIYYCTSSLVIVVLYFIFIFSTPNFSLKDFIIQVTSRNSLSGSDYGIQDNIINFFTTYTLGIKRFYILVFEICILLLGLFLSKKGNLLRYFAFFGLLNFVISLILFSSYSSRHFGEIIIYSFLVLAIVIENIKHNKWKLTVIAFSLVYFVNNFAGDLYIIYKKYKNTSYSEIENKLSSIIPDNSTVITSLHYWYPLRNTEFYCEYTFWESKPYASHKALIKSNTVDYILLTNALFEEKTGTSGRKEIMPPDKSDFFKDVIQFTEKNGQSFFSFPTTGFDTIKVYSMH